jgi:hypothetical protein
VDIAALVNVSSRAWSLAILGALASGTSGRQAALLSATGAGRTAFAASLMICPLWMGPDVMFG